MQSNNLEFFLGKYLDLIETLHNNETKYLLIFDDFSEEISNSKLFKKIATAGRPRSLNTIYIKQKLFHQINFGRDVELQNSFMVFSCHQETLYKSIY